MSDAQVPGIIDDEAAQAFGDEALRWDPRKVALLLLPLPLMPQQVSWSRLDEFNACKGEEVRVPTLVIHGEVRKRRCCDGSH